MLDGEALDRWITGNFGEDYFDGACEGCDEQNDCPWDFNIRDCNENAETEALEHQWEVETGR